jgi:hypothetical protein
MLSTIITEKPIPDYRDSSVRKHPSALLVVYWAK